MDDPTALAPGNNPLEYVPGVTENFAGYHAITAEREAELREHVRQCELAYLTCELCKELYLNIGYQAYETLLREIAAELGPTESEQYI